MRRELTREELERSGRQADFLEEFADHVQLRYETFVMFDGPLMAPEKREAIREFVLYCMEQAKRDLTEPRNGDGKSFLERREEARKHED